MHIEHSIADTVANTYLGREVGQRILNGMIRRGDGQEIRAVLWFSDLRDFTGLTPELIVKLADGGVHTLDDLADLAVDELTDLTGHTEEQARAIIMRAREHWFANEAASDA
jgi:transcription termination factor NusA